MVKSMLMREKWYPRPHHKEYSITTTLESAAVNDTCIFPIINYDEGLGSASAYEANPGHASFVEASQPNCFPDSFINQVGSTLSFNMTKGAIETDKLQAIRCGFMMINMSFLEDYTALDEISTLDISEVLELQTEATDRQGYPLWNTVDMVEKFTGSANVPTGTPGLSGIIEAVAWNTLNYYDNLHFFTTAGKLKHVQRGMKWFTLTQARPQRQFKIFVGGKSKRMTPYSFTGLLVTVPPGNTKEQYHVDSETTVIPHVAIDFKYRYSEWNGHFNMLLV